MDFFISHYALTICIAACFAGTIFYYIAPDFCQDVFCVNGRKINPGTFGFSIFFQSCFKEYFLNLIFALPGILCCEAFYGEDETLNAIFASGFFLGLSGLVFGKESSGFSGTAFFLLSMACFYRFCWFGIIPGIIILIVAFATDKSMDSKERFRTLAVLAGLLFSFAMSETSLSQEENSMQNSQTASDTVDFVCPVSGYYKISSEFGYRNDPYSGVRSFHKGLDMACSTGTKIKAAAEGTVESTGFDRIYGNNIVIVHGNGYKTKYAHLQKVLVSKGTHINQGQIIGNSGSTGYSTGPHLHFMILKDEKPVNPESFLKI